MKTITINLIGDCAAWDLWQKHTPLDAEYVTDYLEFDQIFIDNIRKDIDKWRQLYNTFDYFNTEAKELVQSGRFVIFEALGRKIHKKFRDYIEGHDIYGKEYIVEFVEIKSEIIRYKARYPF